MNASASVFTRQDEVRSKIRKVSVFSRYARVVFSAIFAFGLVGSVAIVLIGVFGMVFPGPISDLTLTVPQKIWSLAMTALQSGIWLAIVHQLYRLFGNLAGGSIYTADNVRRVRIVGFLWLASSGFMLLPVVWTWLASMGFVEPWSLTKAVLGTAWPEALNSFVSAGFILLISWVLDVGLYEKDQADALQRDADLVI